MAPESDTVPQCEPLCDFGYRLYFTTFPDPPPRPAILNKLAAEQKLHVRVRPRFNWLPSVDANATYYFFTIDDQLLYLSFFQDWGPLNIAMVYKACILIRELLEDTALSKQRLVLYSSDDPKKKANAALLMALYMMIVQHFAPWEAFYPIGEMEFMSFCDAGRGPSDFSLSIQDCLWGVWKAMQNKLCDMNEFNLEDYEYYEKVENGDWNWLTPNFIAFASPVDINWVKREKEAKEKADGASPLTRTTSASGSDLALQRKLPTPFQNCLDYFEKRGVRLVVRLNTELYDRTLFVDRGIEHLELYFDDGTNPTDDIVRKFIESADQVIEAGGVVAVHCKAGLGRTGTLIGAYLIWKYGFTANEAIAFMRIMRPGSVVGPQQQYMYLKQVEWCKWSAMDEMRKAQAAAAMVAASVVTPATPPSEADEGTDSMQMTPTVPTTLVTPSKTKAAAPPGQPRKTPQAKRVAIDSDQEEEEDELPALGLIPNNRPRVKTSKVAGMVTSSEARPARVTRSTASAAVIRKTTAPSSSPAKTNGQGPNKIPRLATTRTTAAAKAAVAASGQTRQAPTQLPMPTPSRLPTLVHARRPHKPSASLADAVAQQRSTPTKPSDAWMTNNASAVVTPSTKSGRPGLRSVRRRRSSFSAADVVA